MRRVRTLTAALALALCAGLGACGTAQEPAPPSGSPSGAPSAPSAPSASPAPADVSAALTRLEAEHDVAVGLYALDTGTGRVAAHRADERFAYASTFKALAAGAVLERHGTAVLDDVVTWSADDLVDWSPVTEQHVADGLTMREVIDAAVRESDNTAGNLLLDALGGPAGLRDALRAAGDDTTAPARTEPALNDHVPGDDRDTSTPRALAGSLRAYALGDRLDDDARAVLVEALRGSTTGDGTIRAGAPDGWVVGSKTGTSTVGTRNDVGIAWPPGAGPGTGDPVVLAVLVQAEDGSTTPDDALLAEATAVTFEALGH